MADITIYLGNKNYSSWSLRAWLMLKRVKQPFDEVVIPLYETDSREAILRHSPSGKVPVLHYKGTVVWDSLAIGEFLAENHTRIRLWPRDPAKRAHARAISAEMHAGFMDLRRSMPMNMRSSFPGREVTPEAHVDINRITAIWRDCRMRFGQDGDFLFGGFTIADAMFAPVVSRFKTYGVALDDTVRAYSDAIWNLPEMQQWYEAARNEPWIIPKFEF
jgi:glutathione S-transferase